MIDDCKCAEQNEYETWGADSVTIRIHSYAACRCIDFGLGAMLDVSVLLVTFNHEQYVRRALDSISSQITTRTMEVVVADDNSTDASVAIILDWAAGVEIPVRILDSESRLGITRNYRRGFNACQGQYVVVLEGDDEWISTDKVDLQATELDAQPHLSMVANRVLFFDESRSLAVVIPSVSFESMRSEFSSSEIAKNNWFATFSSCMYRLELLRRIPPAIFDTTSYDWAINMAVTEFGPAGFLPQVMTLYRQHSAGQWSKLDLIQQDQQLARGIPEYLKIFGPRLRHELTRVLGEVEGRLTRALEAEAEIEADAEAESAVGVEVSDIRHVLPIPRVIGGRGPRVSVVMACHNDGEILLDSVTSVLSQTVRDIEVIIADDGSEDDSIRVLAGISDPRLRVYCLESRHGAAAALNLALQQTRAEFVAVIEPAALWKPDKLERQLEKIEGNPLLGAIFTSASVLDTVGTTLPERPTPAWTEVLDKPNRSQAQWLRLFFTEGNFLCHSTALVRRRFYEEHGLYDSRLSRQFDYERWIELVKHLHIEVLGDDPLVQLRSERSLLSATMSDPTQSILLDIADHDLVNESFFDRCSTEMIVDSFGDFLRQGPNYGPGELDCEIAMLWLNTPGSRHQVNRMQALRELSRLERDPVSARLLLTRYGFDDLALHDLGRLVHEPSTREQTTTVAGDTPQTAGRLRIEEASARQLVSAAWSRVRVTPFRSWVSRVAHHLTRQK